MGIEINYGNDVFALPKDFLNTKLVTSSEADVKVLLILASDKSLRASYPESAEEIAERLHCSVRDVDVSVSFWRGAGVLSTVKAEVKRESRVKALISNEIPEYSGEEIQNLMEQTNGSLSSLINECQSIVGKIFNTVEVNTIVALSDYLKLEDEHIMMLCQYCKSHGKSSVHYIEKTAFNLYNEGIDTLQKFEEYIKGEEKLNELGSKLRTLFGMGDRTMTSKEKGLLKQWTGEWSIDYDMIEKAYEITVENTGKLSMPYLNKILSNWHDEGYKSVEEVENAISAYKKNKDDAFNENSSFDTDEFWEAALRRSYEKIK